LNDSPRTARGPFEGYDRRFRDSTLVRSVPYAIALIIMVAVGAGLYFWEGRTQREAGREPQPPSQNVEVPQPQAPPQQQNAETPQPPAAASAEPEIRHPLPAVPPPAGLAGKPVPPLPESDPAMQAALAVPLGKQTAAGLVISNDIARRIVATVDNLPRQKAGTKLLPVKALATRMITRGKGEVVTLSPANYARYAPYVEFAQAVDVKQLVALYVHFYPLFQQAYEELGYPRKYFNDRLVDVIDDLLAAPDVHGPLRLVRPKVLYEFADPELEDLSAGQKILIRIGPDNAAVIKAKLRELRLELGVDGPAPAR
jgi:Protein of unknown function (DUF3014)